MFACLSAQKNLTELFAALIENRPDKIDVDQEDIPFSSQLGESLLDALASDDATEGGDHALAFFGKCPIDKQRGGVRMGAWRASMSLFGLSKIRIEDHLIDRCAATFKSRTVWPESTIAKGLSPAAINWLCAVRPRTIRKSCLARLPHVLKSFISPHLFEQHGEPFVGFVVEKHVAFPLWL